MGEDRENIQVDEDEAVRHEDDVEGHALPEGAVREAVTGEDDVEGHLLIHDNLPDSNLPDSAVRAE